MSIETFNDAKFRLSHGTGVDENGKMLPCALSLPACAETQPELIFPYAVDVTAELFISNGDDTWTAAVKGLMAVSSVTAINYNGRRYVPDIQPRDTLPPVEIFDLVPALAVEMVLRRCDADAVANHVTVVEFWREGGVIHCSAPWWRQDAESWQPGFRRRCVPCQRGDIFARVPWPEGM